MPFVDLVAWNQTATGPPLVARHALGFARCWQYQPIQRTLMQHVMSATSNRGRQARRRDKCLRRWQEQRQSGNDLQRYLHCSFSSRNEAPAYYVVLTALLKPNPWTDEGQTHSSEITVILHQTKERSQLALSLEVKQSYCDCCRLSLPPS